MKKIIAILLILALCSVAGATVSSFSKSGPYTGTGIVGQTFTIGFPFFNTSEVKVVKRLTSTGAETTLTETTDYTITGTGSSPYTGGTVTLVGSIANTSTVTLYRLTTQTQATDLVTGDTLPAETLEDQYDKLEMQVQELQEQVNRCLRVPVTDGSTVEAACALDSSIDRASGYLTFDSNGLPSITTSAIAGTTVSAFGATLVDDTSAAAALTTLGVTAFMQTVLDDANAATARATLGVPDAIVLLDEDDMASNSNTQAPTQQSVKAYVDSGTVTMTNKTLTSPAINTGTLTSPVINTGVSGTAILDEDNMASNSATKLATQQSIKAYVDAQVAVGSWTPSSVGAGTVSVTYPNGLIMKWGSQALVNTTWADTTVTFATAFPNGCYNVQITPGKTNDSSGDYAPYAHTLSATTFKIRSRVGTRLTPIYWLALGY